MKYEQILKDLKNKIYHPLYFLSGEESYFIDSIADFIRENVLEETEKEFNQAIYYGKDSQVEHIIDHARRFPMMSDYQVIIVKEAQDLNGLEQMEEYAAKPLKSTILVFCFKHKKFDKRKKLAKNLQKNGIYFESKKLYDNQVPDWINNHVSRKGYTISIKASLLLSEYLGSDLSKIINELEKLFINLTEATEITTQHIEEHIGISKEFNVFELQKALGAKDSQKSMQITLYFAANQKDHSIVMLTAVLYKFFSKLMIYHLLKDKSKSNVTASLGIHPFFMNDYVKAASNYPLKKLESIISIFREYDLRSKGVNNASTTHGELLKELIYKILNT